MAIIIIIIKIMIIKEMEHSDHQHMEGIDVSIIDTIAKDLMLSYVLRPQFDKVY